MALQVASGAVAHHIPRDQAHPAPGSVVELEEAFRWLQLAADGFTIPESISERVNEVACRLIYRELVRRQASARAEVAARYAALARLGIVNPISESELRAIDGNR